jgi:hypothetical protein
LSGRREIEGKSLLRHVFGLCEKRREL